MNQMKSDNLAKSLKAKVIANTLSPSDVRDAIGVELSIYGCSKDAMDTVTEHVLYFYNKGMLQSVALLGNTIEYANHTYPYWEILQLACQLFVKCLDKLEGFNFEPMNG